MTSDLVTEDMWLDPEDIHQLETLACEMVAQLAAGDAPISVSKPPELEVRNAKTSTLIPIKTAGDSDAPHIADIRAKYIPGSPGVIRLEPFPIQAEAYVHFRSGISAFRQWTKATLGHELTHAKQHFSENTDSEEEKSASDLGKAAETSCDYSDYVTYLAHPYETMAHATQLAIQVMDRTSDELTEERFQQECRRANLWVHMTNHPKFRRITPRKIAETEFGWIEAEILSAAWEAFARMAPVRVISTS